MNPCPICKKPLLADWLCAPALDVYRGDLFHYGRCIDCQILVLQDVPVQSGKVDYSESGYYQKAPVKPSMLAEKIIALYTAHRISMTRNSLRDFSLANKRILDIGCGKGRFLARAQQLGALVSGVEPTRHSYEKAKYRLKGAVQNTIMSKDLFAKETFDVITMWHVFEHVPDPLSMLDACLSALKSDGIIIVAVPNYSGFMAKLGGPVWFNLDPPRHMIHYNVASLSAVLDRAGFEVTRINQHYPELTYLGALQTLLNKLPISNNFLFNFLKRNVAGLPNSGLCYAKDLVLTGVAGILLVPFVFIAVPVFSLLGKSDCITLIARKRQPPIDFQRS